MRWATLTFGKHAGKTLPQIILSDADWVFWAVNKGVLKGRLNDQAAKLVERARAIKIPKRNPKRWQVEYSYDDDTGGFCGFQFVKADTPLPYRSPSIRRSPYLDLSCVRRGKAYDKRGCCPKSTARLSSSLFRRQHSTDQAAMPTILQQ
jgi:hypothetical protein